MIKNYLKVALKVLRRRKFFTFISLFGDQRHPAGAAGGDRPARPRVRGADAGGPRGPHARRLPADDEGAGRAPDRAARLRLSRPLRAADGEAPERRADRVRDGGPRRSSPIWTAARSSPRCAARTANSGGCSTSTSWKGGRSPPRTTSRPLRRRDQRDDARSASSASGRRSERRSRRTASASGWWAWCATSRSSRYCLVRPISGCRSPPRSRAPTRRSGWAASMALILAPQPRRPAADQGGIPVAPARGRKAAPRSARTFTASHRRRRHAVRGACPALLPARAGGGSRRSAAGGAARADAGLHAAADDQPGEHQPEPHPRPGVGDRRAPGVRRLVAHARRAVPDREPGADADRRRRSASRSRSWCCGRSTPAA